MPKMTRIALITVPTPTYNNVRAASALPYHLILGARENGECEVRVWSYNTNAIDAAGISEVEHALDTKIHLLSTPWWYRWLFRLHLVFLRVFLRYPMLAYCKLSREAVAEVEAFDPDVVWVYGEELAVLMKHFPGRRRVMTMPDCEAMYYHRALATDFLTTRRLQIARYAFAYWQYRSMDRRAYHAAKDGSLPVTYHFVGDADAAFFRDINKDADAVFLRHPHYAWRDRPIHFHAPKIRLLFAGRYDIYSQHGSDDLLSAMLRADDLREHYEVTFLGKGWEKWHERLSGAGWTSAVITFADDYIAELHRHDIQVNAIDLGTGTKGKVLDAITNGLLAFGTYFALENIAVSHGESCILYDTPAQAVDILRAIPAAPSRYEDMARRGRDAVLAEHSRKKIAAALFFAK